MTDVNQDNYHFFAVADESEIEPGERIFLEIDSEAIVLFNIAGKLYAIGDMCTHDGGPLGDGDLDGTQVICPRHGARFDVSTGKVLKMPAIVDTPSYPVRIVDHQIEIGIPAK